MLRLSGFWLREHLVRAKGQPGKGGLSSLWAGTDGTNHGDPSTPLLPLEEQGLRCPSMPGESMLRSKKELTTSVAADSPGHKLLLSLAWFDSPPR